MYTKMLDKSVYILHSIWENASNNSPFSFLYITMLVCFLFFLKLWYFWLFYDVLFVNFLELSTILWYTVNPMFRAQKDHII